MSADPDLDAGAFAIDRALRLLDAVVRDEGRTPLSILAKRMGLPLSTAHRMIAALRRRGFISPAHRGHYSAGMGLAALAAHAQAPAILVQAARPLLRRLARSARATAHLGIFEGDMISYIVKEHGGGRQIFTREGGQLEAYCSAIGKVLLAHLPETEGDAYLASGPFIPLTGRTVTDPDAIRKALAHIRVHDFAVDDREIADDLYCVAVPLRDQDGAVLAALSLSTDYTAMTGVASLPIEALRGCSDALSARLYGKSQAGPRPNP